MDEANVQLRERITALETSMGFIARAMEGLTATVEKNQEALLRALNDSAQRDRQEVVALIKENTNNLLGQVDKERAEREKLALAQKEAVSGWEPYKKYIWMIMGAVAVILAAKSLNLLKLPAP